QNPSRLLTRCELMTIWQHSFNPLRMTSRLSFALAANFLEVISLTGDFAFARLLFHRTWSVREYLFPHLAFLFDNLPDGWKFVAVLLLWAAPFAWIGLTLLVKRLRSARAPIPLIFLFFVPVAKFFLFAILCVLSERVYEARSPVLPPPTRRWAPESSLASAGLAVFCSTAIGIGFSLLATERKGAYLSWLFLGLPF